MLPFKVMRIQKYKLIQEEIFYEKGNGNNRLYLQPTRES